MSRQYFSVVRREKLPQAMPVLLRNVSVLVYALVCVTGLGLWSPGWLEWNVQTAIVFRCRQLSGARPPVFRSNLNRSKLLVDDYSVLEVVVTLTSLRSSAALNP